jgi:predicted small lipoprotein YifL
MKFIVTLLLLAGIATSLSACGRRGDPTPANFTQAQ